MARGFDSKSVEYQQEEALRSRQEKRGRPLSEEERARLQRRQTLNLARARTAADLARAASPAQQEMLGRALASLDRELKALG
ncbi:MAG TPA: hypothetical protein VLN08_03775 [Vicinamibacterales bacterium]|nr:hypothetical protein [Vicinamibacterales bacterium]